MSSSHDRWLRVNSRLKVPLDELEFQFARSSGPGGQNVNKVNTKAQLRWNLDRCESLPDSVRQRLKTLYRRRINSEGQLLVSSQRYRDQARNVQDCLDKLREMLAAAAEVPTPRKATRPTKASGRRRLESKRKQGDKKQGRQARFDAE